MLYRMSKGRELRFKGILLQEKLRRWTSTKQYIKYNVGRKLLLEDLT